MKVSSLLHASAVLLREMSPLYALDKRLGGPHNLSECGAGNRTLVV
jgi:hypothetical protein